MFLDVEFRMESRYSTGLSIISTTCSPTVRVGVGALVDAGRWFRQEQLRLPRDIHIGPGAGWVLGVPRGLLNLGRPSLRNSVSALAAALPACASGGPLRSRAPAEWEYFCYFVLYHRGFLYTTLSEILKK